MNKKWLKLKFKQERTFIIFIIVSLLIHISSYFNLKSYVKYLKDNDLAFHDPLKVKYDTDDEIKKKLVNEAKRLVEVEQNKNQRPDKYSHLGANDHSTENEQRADTKFNTPGADASLDGTNIKEYISKNNKKNLDNEKQRVLKDSNKQLNPIYKKFMPELSYNDDTKYENEHETLPRGGKDSHVDNLEKDIKEGNYTDINTVQYKNIGYFIGMRKALEQVWVYPYEAKINRYQGEVGIIFKLEKDGTISNKKVMKSSGYKILDIYAMKALEEARFSPPPKDVYEKSPFYWTFTYQIY